MDMTAKHFTVAIDGPAAAGKGTIGRAVAKHFAFPFMDTGLLYRAVARKLLDRQRKWTAAQAAEVASSLRPEDLQLEGLRSREVSASSSRVASMPEVRSALREFQQTFARRLGGAVLDGRDIGTVICPEAEVKLFVTASLAVRARRRHCELRSASTDVSEMEVMEELRMRDERDRNRADCALKPHDDAVLLDTSEMTIHQAVARAVSAVEDQLRAIRLP